VVVTSAEARSSETDPEEEKSVVLRAITAEPVVEVVSILPVEDEDVLVPVTEIIIQR